MTEGVALAILDGPLGTELSARGVPLPAPLWSAWGLLRAPEIVGAIHRDYAEAGATVHTANTFRTKRRTIPGRWEELLCLAVEIARGAVPRGHRVAGSIAPLEDCYRPERSPADARGEHREMARALASARVDLLLCETFPHVGEALVAVEEAVATGIETWVSFTAGPSADLLSPEAIEVAAREAVRRGASAVLVNCVPATQTQRFVERLAGAGVPFGAYANAGAESEGIGWIPSSGGPEAYAELAAGWIARGASIVGGCCGTGPAHIAKLAERFGGLAPRRGRGTR